MGVKQQRYSEELHSNHGISVGDQLAGPHQRDPHEYLKQLSTKWSWPPPSAKLKAPPTATHFLYRAQDRMDSVEALWRGVVQPSWQAYRSGYFDDKKAWSTGFIHGASGVGKTRFNLEFLALLADYLTSDASKAYRSPDDEVESLHAALKNSKTVVLDIRHNGLALKVDETEWPPEVILGLRLAHNYWWPHVPYSEVYDAFRWQVREDPTLWGTFSLGRVLFAIRQHKAAPTRDDPSPRIPSMLHIAIDEIQSVFDTMAPYGGGSSVRSAPEPLSTALNRALQGAISQSQGLYVLGTLSGTAARHATEVLHATDATSTGVLLSPLSAKTVRQIVASFQFRFEPQPGQPEMVSGQEWLEKGGKPFERLLTTIGGNARALECLERVLKTQGSPSKPLRLNQITTELTKEVRNTFNIESWGRKGSGQFGLLLALAGIPVTRESVVAFEEPSTPQQPPRPITVAELEKIGVVHLRPPPPSDPGQPDSWVNTWDVQELAVMEVPFVLAKAALDLAVKSKRHQRHQLHQLLKEASRLLADFYPTAASFEKLALEHRVLRHNVASEWARRQGLTYVDAADLFCGTICHPSLTELSFVPAATVRHVSEPAGAGVWWRAAKGGGPQASKEVPPTSVILEDGTTVELGSTSPYALLLSGSNAVDGVLNEQLSHTPPKNVRVYIDTKHTQIGAPADDALSYSDDIKALISKRRYLAEQFPEEEHIMVITSNKRAQQPGGKPHTAATLLRVPTAGRNETTSVDPRTCIITVTDDSLAWAMSQIGRAHV